MDVWIVAAAAGAGYVAERLKNLTRGKHAWPNFLGPKSVGSIEVQGKSFKYHRLSGKPLVEEMCREKESFVNDASIAGMDSTSGLENENFVMLDNFASHSKTSNSSVSFSNNEDIRGDWESRVSLDFDSVDARDLLPEPSSREIGFSYGFRGNRSSLRSRPLKSKLIKPQSALESCLVAQLYQEYSEIEEYTYSKHPLERPTLRPFVVTDGSRIINRRSRESFLTGEANHKSQKDVYMQDCTSALGVPRLPNLATPGLQKKAKVRPEKQQGLRRKSREIGNLDRINEAGPNEGAFLFYLGLTTGIITSFMANKREEEKLHKLLKQSENLVQDLQEELEMKDSLTVKELEMEDFGSRDLHTVSYCENAEQAQKPCISSMDSKEELCPQEPEKESMSQIEAELEAELERLESNINSTRLERKISNMAEQHPDFVSDVTVGELRADLFGAKTGTQPYNADRDGSGSSTGPTAQYPVDPRELSLRLHEVIQSRLEGRISELEAALQNSQRKVMDYEHSRPIDFPIYGTSSPVVRDGQPSLDQPVVINLSGEALSAYNEAFEELNKSSDSDEEGPGNHQEIFHEHNQGTRPVKNGELNGYVVPSTDETPQTVISCGMRGDQDDDDVDESEDSDDEMERLLIRQIVEKARQGSPALLKAQRCLLLNDGNEH